MKAGRKSYWKRSSAAGLVAALTFSAQLWSEIDPGRSRELHDGPSGELSGVAGDQDFLGEVIVVGDFDGDGYDDIAASERDSEPSPWSPGAVHVVYGGPEGPSTVDDQLWTNFDPITLLPLRPLWDRFGYSLAAGDFNGDRFDDLAIGNPADFHGKGAVLVLYGGPDGLDIYAAPPPRTFRVGWDGVGGSSFWCGNLGVSLAAGDFDFDGNDDLAIGAPGTSSSQHSGMGALLVLYGSLDGLRPDRFQLFDQDTSDGSGQILDEAESHDGFGSSLAAGDFNFDGAWDLAVGARGESADSGCGQGAGAVHIIYGTPRVGLLARGNQLWTEHNVRAGGDCEAGDEFGTTLVAGDLHFDRAADLVIGTPYEDVGGLFDAGAVTVLAGREGVGLTADGSQLLDASAFPELGGVTRWEQLGYAVAIGDFREEPSSERDLAIGVPWYSSECGSEGCLYSGSVVLVRGSGAGELDLERASLIEPGRDGAPGQPSMGRRFGASLGGGQFDGDGFGDLVVGVPGDDIYQENAGALAIFFGTE